MHDYWKKYITRLENEPGRRCFEKDDAWTSPVPKHAVNLGVQSRSVGIYSLETLGNESTDIQGTLQGPSHTHWAYAARQHRRWPYMRTSSRVIPAGDSSCKACARRKRLQYSMASGAQAAESRRASVIEKLKNAKLPEYTQDSFAASRLILPTSSRTILTHGMLRMQRNAEGNEDSVVVIKSLNGAYATHRTGDKAEEDKYRNKLFSYFERETDIWIRARSHPNITSLCGFMPYYGMDNLPVLIFPFHRLGNLRMYVYQHEMSSKSKLLLLRDVVHGLKHLHGLQDPIVHRDLSGSNVLLKETPTGIVACINDFGSAKLIDPDLNVVCSSTQATNYKWQPPEYVKSKTFRESYTNPKPSGDIWSFACVVLEILTEGDPWPRTADVVVELEKGHHPPYPNKDFKKKYGDFLEGCWRSSPGKRYTAEKVISKLDSLINAES
ncbi:kinase-like protein [Fomitiporia mediterranea MF3/22]|uniref:kinase-like protein n=1 Tax=Fomitiporia mediterranea (strain MF3/22) TaxID=694068 RepID=UPI0004409682|nr:kinase-like protein [Fomitiporia mediterranea MF3/22]EJC99786.1 kinase-like protein [Fomitiporia mediterranea MF3/22]